MQTMQQLMYDLVHNHVLVTVVIAWFTAQLIKVVLVLIQSKRLRWERMIGAGGMPSSHSASVCALVVTLAKGYGVSSPWFGIAFLFAMVVMHDAMGVRLEAGKHAKLINMLIKKSDLKEVDNDKDLKELLGHTTLQVIAGALLGILIGLVIPVF